MKKNTVLITMIALLISCTRDLPLVPPDSTATATVTEVNPTEERSVWGVYDPAPDHPWNRVFRQLYRRTASNRAEYGSEELGPLLWLDTSHLLNGPSHQQALQVLDEFLSTHAENLIRDPLKRAMFQRDMWAVFDWSTSQSEPYPSERKALETRLAQIIRSVALSKEEIGSLPNNYALEIKSHTFPVNAPAHDPEAAFLPAELFQADSAWVPMGREGGPIAMTHTEAFPFFGRSVFLVFVRSPIGREGTLDFIGSLNTGPNPVTAVGSDVALVRRMLLIDDQGDLALSPLVETIQIRHFNPEQHFHEFELDRARLFQGLGGLVSKKDIFLLFMSHGDVFENPVPELRAAIPEICKACHSEYPPIFHSGNTHSIISYSRQPFSLSDNSQPILFPTTLEEEAQTVIQWKRNHETWKSLKVLWGQTNP